MLTVFTLQVITLINLICLLIFLKSMLTIVVSVTMIAATLVIVIRVHTTMVGRLKAMVHSILLQLVATVEVTDATFAGLMDLDLREALKAMSPKFCATHSWASQSLERCAPACRGSHRLVLCITHAMTSKGMSGAHHLGHHAGQSSECRFCQQVGSKLIG